MLTTSRFRPAATCSGFSTGIAPMVVQFGLATMPLGRWSSVCGFTSATTSGTSGSIRHADELSMTVTPAAANRGASAREPVAPAENSAMSSPVGSATSASSTAISSPFHGSVRPTERAEAKYRSSSTGKPRSARIARITLPTWPVAPTTPTRMGAKVTGGPSRAKPQFRRLRRRARTPCAAPAPTDRRRRRRRRS